MLSTKADQSRRNTISFFQACIISFYSQPPFHVQDAVNPKVAEYRFHRHKRSLWRKLLCHRTKKAFHYISTEHTWMSSDVLCNQKLSADKYICTILFICYLALRRPLQKYTIHTLQSKMLT